MAVSWLTAFLDTPAPQAEGAERFWAAVTGWPLSSRRGAGAGFATLQPPDGHAVLKTQVVGEAGAGMLHLDVHTDDVGALSQQARDLGAGSDDGTHEGYAVHRSPGGLTFCVVPHPAQRRPGPVAWPGGRSLVDQVCLDIPGPAFDREADFWAALLGWRRQAGSLPEFERLLPPSTPSLHVLLQRLGEPQGGERTDGRVRAHLDLAADDVAAEVGRHLGLGARDPRVERHWTTLRDPAGRSYCVTGRRPDTGRLP